MPGKGLLERLENGGSVVVAEGYIFEFERKGYLQAGSFVPEVILEHPELVRLMYEEFVHAGSDVVLAFTYYAHREKLRVVGREDDLVAMNTTALKMAREVADKHGALMAGNICNSSVYEEGKDESNAKVEAMFKEQIELAVTEGADFVVGETFGHFGEAMLALKCIQKYGNGLPAVITFSIPKSGVLFDGVPIVEACKKLEGAGAAVVGFNCGRGPATMLPILETAKQEIKVPIAAVPVPYRTTPEQPTFFNLDIPGTDKKAFPLNLCACLCSRDEIADFATKCKQMGIQYIGLCCGNAPNFIRIVAEIYDKNPAASKYSPNMSNHYIFGDQKKFKTYYSDEYRKHITGQE